MTVRAETIGEVACELGESPLWIPERGELVWLDITGRALHAYDARDGVIRSLALSATVTAIGLSRGHQLVVATASGFGSLDPVSGTATPLSMGLAIGPGERMNDGAVAPDGSFWAGSQVPEQRAGAASLWRWREGSDPELVLDGVTISNGMDWLADGPTSMLYVDSFSGGVDRLTFSGEGEIVERRRIIEIDRADGEPDGLCLDEDGRAWVAIWGGSEVRAYDVHGRLQEVVVLPVRNPSSCTFGDADRRTLYITSAREDLAAPGPIDGRLLACRLPVRGGAPRRFAGLEVAPAATA